MSELNKHQRRGSGPNPTPEREREECLRRKISFDGLPRETKRSVVRRRMRAGATAACLQRKHGTVTPPHLLYSWNFHNQTDIHTVPLLSLRRGSYLVCVPLQRPESGTKCRRDVKTLSRFERRRRRRFGQRQYFLPALHVPPPPLLKPYAGRRRDREEMSG